MASNQEYWQICKEVQKVLENHNISYKYNKEIMKFVLKVIGTDKTDTKSEVLQIYLYKVRKEFFLDFEGTDHDYTDKEYVFHEGERYFVRWVEGLEWPQIYIPRYKEWHDITLDCEKGFIKYLKDDIHMDIFLELVPYHLWESKDIRLEEELLR